MGPGWDRTNDPLDLHSDLLPIALLGPVLVITRWFIKGMHCNSNNKAADQTSHMLTLVCAYVMLFTSKNITPKFLANDSTRANYKSQ